MYFLGKKLRSKTILLFYKLQEQLQRGFLLTTQNKLTPSLEIKLNSPQYYLNYFVFILNSYLIFLMKKVYYKKFYKLSETHHL